MSRALKEAAESALLQWQEAAPVTGRVERITIDVALGGERELVSLRYVGGDLRWACTCLERSCDHVRVALSMIASESEPGAGQRFSEVYDGQGRSIAPVMLQPEHATRPDDRAALAEALDDVVTAIVRVGIRSIELPSVSDTLERLLQAAPEPLPLGISRWMGRLEIAIGERSVDAVARMLAGASRLAEDLRSDTLGAEASQRLVAWLGRDVHSAVSAYQISDRTMLEMGREFLDGVERGGIERRYLIDLDSGEVYREEGPRGRPAASLGTCPRVVHVGLAEVERAAEPRRIRLLQYVSVPVLTASHWGQMQNWAVRAFEPLPERYRAAVGAFPGLAEPFVVVAPDAHIATNVISLLDDAGHALPLSGGEEPSVLEYFEHQTQGETPTWIAGRLVDRAGVMMLRPVSMGKSHHGSMDHVRF